MWDIAHLDVKFDNFVISSKNNGKAMLIDFNSAVQYTSSEKRDDRRGTEAFFPPELRVNNEYQCEEHDLFSLGCTLYTLYYGTLCCDEDFDFTEDTISYEKDTPVEIKELMKGLLEYDCKQRWTWVDVWNCKLFDIFHKGIEVKGDKKKD